MSKNSIFGTGFILLSLCFSYCVASDTADNNIPNESVDEAAVTEATTAKKSVKKPGKKFSAKELSGTMKEVEVNSVNFIKLKEKAGEIFIPNPDIIDVQLLSDNSLYLMGLAPGETTLVINGKKGNVLIDCKVRVTYPIKTIKNAIKEMHPDTSVDILSVDKSVILRGRVPSPEVAADVQEIVAKFIESSNIVNKLSIETATQVLLKVKIAEVNRELTKSLGVNFRTVSTPNTTNGLAYGFSSGNASSFFEHITNDQGVEELKTNLLKSSGMLSASTGGHWLVHTAGHNGVSGLIDALAQESFASVLAEPTIMAMSGTKAEFKSGGEFGYTVTQPGENTTTTEFKEWGTSIEFTPVVLSEDRINITVTPKVSTIEGSTTDKAPALSTKEATTTVELGSGQSLAIAGLLQTNTSSASNETPFLADLPLLGALFRDSKVTKTQRELVIIVTPYIVKPSSKQLKVPTDMIPRMYSPLESLIARKFHKNIKKIQTAGFSIK